MTCSFLLRKVFKNEPFRLTKLFLLTFVVFFGLFLKSSDGLPIGVPFSVKINNLLFGRKNLLGGCFNFLVHKTIIFQNCFY